MKPLEKLYQEYYKLFELQSIIPEELDYSILESHIAFLTRLDVIENSSLSVFDLNRREHVFISRKYETMLGYDINEIRQIGNAYFDRKIHPEDFYFLLRNGIELLKLAFSSPVEEICNHKLISDYRILNGQGHYVRIIEQQQALEVDKRGNIWLALSVLDISPDQDLTSSIKSRLYNFKTGQFLPMPVSEDDLKTEGQLTRREKEILKMIQTGMPSKEIAEKLFISVHTVNTHRQRILEKLEVSNSLEAIQYANRLGILD